MTAAARAGQVATVVVAEIQLFGRFVDDCRFFVPTPGNFRIISRNGSGDGGCLCCEKRAALFIAIVKASIQDAFANFQGDWAVPDLSNRLVQKVADRSFQPGRAAEENIAVWMDFEPFEGTGAEQGIWGVEWGVFC